jgi:hypothetical protein
MDTPEPWLRGSIPGVSPLIMPVLHSFLQVREDLQKYALGLGPSDVWCNVNGASMGFHLKHIAGSVERLTAYLMGAELTPEQIAAVRAEHMADEDSDSLITLVDLALCASEQKLRTIAPESLHDERAVGRKRLPTTVLGLLVHLAEHTQRHLGQIITLSKIVRQSV